MKRVWGEDEGGSPGVIYHLRLNTSTETLDQTYQTTLNQWVTGDSGPIRTPPFRIHTTAVILSSSTARAGRLPTLDIISDEVRGGPPPHTDVSETDNPRPRDMTSQLRGGSRVLADINR